LNLVPEVYRRGGRLDTILTFPSFLEDPGSPPMTDPSRQQIAAASRLIVVKVGSRVLTGADGLLDTARVESLGRQIAALSGSGRQVVLVSSGAVAAGMGRLGLPKRPTELAHLQAVAAVGQSCLIEAWDRSLRDRGRHAAQVLLVAEDLSDRTHYLNIRNTLRTLLEYGGVPVINENDTVSTEELRTSFGDNDHLAALVASLLGAQLRVGNRTSAPLDSFFYQGGLSVSIGLDGTTRNAVQRNASGAKELHPRHPDSGSQLVGVSVPHWDETLAMLLGFQREVPAFDFVGWDVLITEEGPVVIEGNHNPGLRTLLVHHDLSELPEFRAFCVERRLLAL